MRSLFLKRRYPEEIIDKEISKVKFHFSRKIKPKCKGEKGVPLIVTYHPSLNCLSKNIKKKLYLLYMNNQVQRVFSPKPMIPFKITRKLSNYLVKAKIYPIEKSIGSFECGKKRCEA